MSEQSPVPHGARRSCLDDVLRRLFCTHNPLYAISAALVFYGLRVSFRTEESDHAAMLLGSLAAYVVLLAGTAVFLRRVGALWEDVRMLALLVLLLLLAISVTFDRTLLADRLTGTICFVVGWLLAVIVCEFLFDGLRVRLRLGYRLPFHALLALFYLYPLLAANYASQVDDRTLTWILLSFPTAAAVLLLTLLPATMRGASYVADNGTPWKWPLFPLTLFFFLTLGVVGRSYYLCYSFHAVPDGQSIFGWYFLSPLVLAIGLIAMLVGRHSTSRIAARTAPPLAVWMTLSHPVADPTHREFLTRFAAQFTAGPTSIVLLLGIAFYLVAVARRVPCATACLFIFCFLTTARSQTIDVWPWQQTHWPFTAAAVIATLATIRTRETRWAWATMFSAGAAVCVAAMQARHVPVVFATLHAAAITGFAMSLLVRDSDRMWLRAAAAGLVFVVFSEALTGRGLGAFRDFSPGARYYPLSALAVVLAVALLLRDRPTLAFLGLLTAEWLGIVGWREYRHWRKMLPGLDAVVLGLVTFAAALLVSLSKTERYSVLRLVRASRTPAAPVDEGGTQT